MNYKVYIAGGLFNEAEIAQRKKEGELLRQHFNDKLIIFNPIEQPFNKDKSNNLPTPIDIFNGDTKAVLESDIFIADITNDDPGVLVELGIAIRNRTKIIICVNSDIRLKGSNKYEIPPYSMNHYVLGGILKYGHLVNSFDEAINKLKELLSVY